tara:strand:- start:416 stop:1456 length:1041 start_codon:yes stop_codon:yes gene_type:complete
MKFKNDFPLLKSCTYFNTAYVGLMSKSLYDFRVNFERSYLQNGDEYKLKAYKDLPQTEALIASFIGSKKEQTYFVSNFSTGIRYIMNLLPENTNVLYIKEDYHSLVSSIEEKKFNLFPIEMSDNIETVIAFSLEENPIDTLVISMVQYTNGLLVDFDFLSDLKQKYPRLSIIGDATQYIGTDVFNFNDSPFDAIVCSGYKWLLAGFGNGFVALSDAFLAKNNSSSKQFAGKVYAGHFNILGAASLVFALERLKENDFIKLVETNQHLSNELRNALVLNGYKPTCHSRKKHSSIISINYNEGFLKLLEEKNIKVAKRGDYIRFSIHFYNTLDDIKNLIEVIKKMAIV